MGDDEIRRMFERADLADFIRPALAGGPTVDLTFPEHLEFSHEQRAFIDSLVSRVVENLAYELSHKWTSHLINVLVAGDWRNFQSPESAAAPE